ncbi:hypothetical protein RhiirC2_789721 [Rhizophagus irregularis]|uniref:Uncharacterized protein n=1 Tax=Rhizophagus irregularis TaxID=588596 RepID=A0A2N1MMK1_9GLOM|nr:hypothetical protein RhiirC2_789721 [Rhizophagus irregularis]
MVVDTVIKPNRNSVATSLGYEFQGQDKDDDIDYVKEVLTASSACLTWIL